MLVWLQLQKLKSTYLDGLLCHVQRGGQLFTHWDHTAAATGRLTATRPNVQGVPKQPLTITTTRPSCIIGGHIIKLANIYEFFYSFLIASIQELCNSFVIMQMILISVTDVQNIFSTSLGKLMRMYILKHVSEMNRSGSNITYVGNEQHFVLVIPLTIYQTIILKYIVVSCCRPRECHNQYRHYGPCPVC